MNDVPGVLLISIDVQNIIERVFLHQQKTLIIKLLDGVSIRRVSLSILFIYQVTDLCDKGKGVKNPCFLGIFPKVVFGASLGQ